jgi:protein-L-isoaspartate(D-aspartate) O-methyltransferase
MGETDYQKLRDQMVSTQIATRGVRDEAVLRAMRTVPRHEFVTGDYLHRAYDDNALPIGEGQTISQPYMVAVMTEMLELSSTEKVLEVGTGSGYQSAVLSMLASEIYTIERHAPLAWRADDILKRLGYMNVHVVVGDGTQGVPEQSPFDRIIVTAGAPSIPEPLIRQLADGGIILAPVGGQYGQELIRLRREGNTFTESYGTPCVFVPLIGKYGWEE